MSLACVTSYLGEVFPQLLTELKNGECRFWSLSDNTATDAQGFISSDHAPRTIEFLPCSWIPQKKLPEEIEIAAQTRATAVYKISVAFGTIVKPSDKLELRFKLGAVETQFLEIISVVNHTNVFWQVYAVDIEE